MLDIARLSALGLVPRLGIIIVNSRVTVPLIYIIYIINLNCKSPVTASWFY